MSGCRGPPGLTVQRRMQGKHAWLRLCTSAGVRKEAEDQLTGLNLLRDFHTEATKHAVIGIVAALRGSGLSCQRPARASSTRECECCTSPPGVVTDNLTKDRGPGHRLPFAQTEEAQVDHNRGGSLKLLIFNIIH